MAFFERGSETPEGYVSVTDHGAIPNDGESDFDAFVAALDAAADARRHLYVPAGSYLLDRNLLLKSRVAILGDAQGISLIRGTPAGVWIGDNQYGDRVTDLTLSHLHFSDITVSFYGRADRIRTEHCLFVPLSPPTTGHLPYIQYFVGSGRAPEIRNSVFLRDQYSLPVSGDGVHHGMAIYFYNTNGGEMRRNVIGLDLDRTEWLDNFFTGESGWVRLREKIAYLRETFNLVSDQGGYRKGAYFVSTRDNAFRENVINGSLHSPFWRDHALYALGNERLVIEGNLFKGWPNNAAGGVKVRNQSGTYIASNRFDDVSIISYTYDLGSILHFRDVTIYNNDFHIRSWPYTWSSRWAAHAPIYYYQDRGLGRTVHDYRVAGNTFYSANPSVEEMRVFGGHPEGFTVYDSNRDGDGNPIGIRSSRGPIRITSERIPEAQRTVFEGLPVPDFVVPDTAPPSTRIPTSAFARVGTMEDAVEPEGGFLVEGAGTGHFRGGLLAFDLSRINQAGRPDVQVFLRLKVIEGREATVSARRITGRWDVDSAAGNRPPRTGPVLASRPVSGEAGWIRLDVTEALFEARENGETTLSFQVESPSADGVSLGAPETEGAPELRVYHGLSMFPVADVHTRARTPYTSYAVSSLLRIGGEDLGYMKFRKNFHLNNVGHASLRIRPFGNCSHGVTLHTASHVRWEENTVSHNVAPEKGIRIGTEEVGADGWITFDITEAANDGWLAASNIGFVLETGTPGGCILLSRESTRPPELHLRTEYRLHGTSGE